MIFFFYCLHCDYFTFIFLNHKSKWKWIPVSRLHGLPPPLCGLLSPQLCLEIATSCVSYRFLYVRHPSPPQERRFQPSFLRSSNPATESFSTEWTRHCHPNETHLPCTNTCSLSGFSLFPAIRPTPPAQMSDPGEGGRDVFLLSPSRVWVEATRSPKSTLVIDHLSDCTPLSSAESSLLT